MYLLKNVSLVFIKDPVSQFSAPTEAPGIHIN